jgi:hypothetical protein
MLAAYAQLNSVAALLQLCCSSVAALLQLKTLNPKSNDDAPLIFTSIFFLSPPFFFLFR